MSKKVKMGILGAGRGLSMLNYCRNMDDVEVVAVCDNNPELIETYKETFDYENITIYMDYDEFIKHDMDAIMLANYAHEHAPFAIKALRAGKHVFSEVLPCQTMKEAVELIEAVEETGKIYAYGENYCYMGAPYEMRRLYKSGAIGEFEYGEGEYIHNCMPGWHALTYGEEDHWRNTTYSTFYCTHSLGPLIHITGLRPVSVTGFEGTMIKRNLEKGSKSGAFGIEMVTLENGGIIKSIHGGLYKNSVWYCVYGSKGRLESSRELVNDGGHGRIYTQIDEYENAHETCEIKKYTPEDEHSEKSKNAGHGGSDFYSKYNFIEAIKGNPDADIIDVYEALDMFLPGMFAYRSILKGGIPMDIPNLRNKEERDKWRNDTSCTDPKVAGDMLLPTFSKGTPDIDPAVYAHMKELWEKVLEERREFEKKQLEERKNKNEK